MTSALVNDLEKQAILTITDRMNEWRKNNVLRIPKSSNISPEVRENALRNWAFSLIRELHEDNKIQFPPDAFHVGIIEKDEGTYCNVKFANIEHKIKSKEFANSLVEDFGSCGNPCAHCLHGSDLEKTIRDCHSRHHRRLQINQFNVPEDFFLDA